MSLLLDSREYDSIHFVGILGSGMSALAQYLAWDGCDVSGSDRSVSHASTKAVCRGLRKAKCRLYPQDGSGISPETGCVVISTAIEEDNPDLAAAQRYAIPVFHRSEILSALVAAHKSVAVAGTSGKSTVAAMIFECARACKLSPSLITGAPLCSLTAEGLIGNAFKGTSDLLIIEADESDGSLVRYTPHLSLFLNISRDHHDVSHTLMLFKDLASHSHTVVTNADDTQLRSLPSHYRFSLEAPSDFCAKEERCSPRGSMFSLHGTQFELPLPGRHNIANFVAALAVIDILGGHRDACVKVAAGFQGIARRFTRISSGRGVTVIDDYAHNPEKIRAALQTAHLLSLKVFAIFQPHGFGPTQFLMQGYIDVFRKELSDGDELLLLPIFYAGGTARRSVSSEELARAVVRPGCAAAVFASRDSLIAHLVARSRHGAVVLVMGARDPSLSAFAVDIARSLS